MAESQPLIPNSSYHALDDYVGDTGSVRSFVPEDPMLSAPTTTAAQTNPVDAARDTVGEQIFNTTSGFTKAFRLLWNVCELIVLILVLVLTRHRACGSDDPWENTKLKFLIGMYIFFTAGVILSLILDWPVHQRSTYRFFTQASTVCGAISLFSILEGTCNKTNKPLFIVILVISSVNFLTVALPFLLLFLLLCCFPCLIVVLSFFPWLQDKEAGPATDAELELLPSFEYHPDTYDQAGDGYPESTKAHTADIEKMRNLARTQTNSRSIHDIPDDLNNNNNNTSSYTDDAPQCAICLCEYEEGESLRRFKCHHDYHQGCIDSWLKTKAVCPVCRVQIFERDEHGNVLSINGTRLDGESGEGTYQNPNFELNVNSLSSSNGLDNDDVIVDVGNVQTQAH